MNQRRGRIQRGFNIRHRRQRLIIHLDELQRVFSLRPRVRHHHHHRLALPARHTHRQRQLRRRLHALDVFQHAHIGLAHRSHVRARNDAHHAQRVFRCRNVEPCDTRMRMRAAQHGGVQHAWQLHIVYVLSVSCDQALGVGAWE